jgi:hypothetical protein
MSKSPDIVLPSPEVALENISVRLLGRVELIVASSKSGI